MTTPIQLRRLSVDVMQAYEARIQAIAERCSPCELVKLQSVSWADLLKFVRSTCPWVIGLPDADIQTLYAAFQRIVAANLDVAGRAHWMVGNA